ncbi:hypothetical protein GmRootA79_44300 [Acidovorax sp. A79]|uniref:DUF2199 domain-containing protein n=1 Tax=Acidovorax sp. A79 TaxID=3056107 RepID=UPI0034E8B985
MAYTCASCGKDHDELSPYMMWRLPDPALEREHELVFDDDFTCRIGDEQYFISCELEVPFKADDLKPLGFICWARVDRETYDRYRGYREHEDTLAEYAELVPGTLANPIPCVPGSSGTAVGLKVLAGDPTPYIRWVDPGSAVAHLLARGATVGYWHEAMGAG